MPRGRKGAYTEITPEKKANFLLYFAECGNVTQAAKRAGFARETAHRMRVSDPDFAEGWRRAARQAAAVLAEEAWRRGHDGWLEPVHQGGKKIGTIRKYDTTLMIFLMKSLDPETYRDNYHITGSLGVSGIQQLLDTMRGNDSNTDAANDVLAGLSAFGATR